MSGTFKFKVINDIRDGFYGTQHVDWEVTYYGTILTGRSKSVRAAYRDARRAVRRERRMWHFLNPPK